MKYRLLLLCALILLCFSACDSSSSSYTFKTSVYGNPKTLDPQTALNDSSSAVIGNVFQGLFAFDSYGNIVNGMIDEYNTSDDGLVWIFSLKKGIKWYDGDGFIAECTAYDYEFSFKRLFNPQTKSKRASEYYIIKNSQAIREGVITDLSYLGVKAVDEYTLEITLEKPCVELKELLALPPAMPCNKDFFEKTQGRYGLSADCLASNSGYYVHAWSYDEWSDENNYFILRRNTRNELSEAYHTSINLFIDPVDELKFFEEGTFHSYIGKTIDEISDLKGKYSFTEYKNDVWGIIFNLDGKFGNLDYRLALADNISFTPENDIYTEIRGILYNQNYQLQKISDSKVGSLSAMKIIMPEGTGLRGSVSGIMQNWQSECGFYCGLSELEQKEYISALSAGNFDIAVVKLSAEYNSPYAYFNDFLAENESNYSGYSSEKYAHIINSALTAPDFSTAELYYKEAEQLLIESAVFIPLCRETNYVFYSIDSVSVSYNPFSGVYSFSEKEQ